MIVLSLDLATRTGWCAARAGDPVRVGTNRLPSTGKDMGTFLNAHLDFMERAIINHRPDVVVYESPILRSGNTQIATLRKLYSLAGVTEMACANHGLKVFEVHLQTAKAMLAGTGRAQKHEMIKAARRRGVDVEDDNQADAFAVFLVAVKMLEPDALSAYAERGSLL